VQTVETTNPDEARRCRSAQYRGQPAELSLNGSRFFGMIRSVQEVRSSRPQRWIVTIVPKEGPQPRSEPSLQERVRFRSTSSAKLMADELKGHRRKGLRSMADISAAT
jgi:hypothetical protein